MPSHSSELTTMACPPPQVPSYSNELTTMACPKYLPSSHPSQLFPPQAYQWPYHGDSKDIQYIPSDASPDLYRPTRIQDDYVSTSFTLPSQDQPTGVNALSREALHKCHSCDHEFSTHMELGKHFKVTHKSNDQYQCNICDKKYDVGGDLNKHFLVHLKPYWCCYCGRSFTKESHFNGHQIKCKMKTYKCEYCNARFAEDSSLKNHGRKCTGTSTTTECLRG